MTFETEKRKEIIVHRDFLNFCYIKSQVYFGFRSIFTKITGCLKIKPASNSTSKVVSNVVTRYQELAIGALAPFFGFF